MSSETKSLLRQDVSKGDASQAPPDDGDAPEPRGEVDAALFLREDDATPDGTLLRPGDTFTKTWIVRNAGPASWSDRYRLIHVGGETMGASSPHPIPPTLPGAECRVTLNLTAPPIPGKQRSTWRLANADGQLFGDPVWAEINVLAPPRQSANDAGAPTASLAALALEADDRMESAMVANTWNRYRTVIAEECERLDIEPAAAVAILATESRGEPFDSHGRMVIRFENHIFFRQWGVRNEELFDRHFTFNPDSPSTGHYWRPTGDGPMQPCHTNNAAEWDAFEFARRLDDTAALSSISMGAAQIMGFNHKSLGYATPQAMFDDLRSSGETQVQAMFRFMEVNSLVDAIRLQDYHRFARVYNGPLRPGYYANLMHGYAAIFIELLRNAQTADSRQASEQPEESSRTPQPVSPMPGVPLAIADPELYAAWRKHIENGFKNNDTMFRSVLDAFMNPYWSTVWMYRILFAVGVLSFIVAAVLGFTSGQPVTALIFGGLSVTAFLGFFISRPLQALEENLQFITWLGIIYNTYWSRLVQAQNPVSYAQELDKATDDALKRIVALMDKHAERSSARPKPE